MGFRNDIGSKKNNDGSSVSFEELLKKEGLTYADL